MNIPALTLLCLLLSCATATMHLIPQVHSITVVLGPDERCVHVYSKTESDRIYFHYQVRQGSNDFDVRVDGPSGSTIFFSANGDHDEEGKVYFLSKMAGEHSMCLTNQGVGKSEKVIRLSVALMSLKRSRKKVNALLQSMSKSEAGLIKLTEDQGYLRSRDVEHRTTLESNNTRLAVRWFIEAAVLLAMSVGQVVYLRKLFQKKVQRAA